MLSGILGPGIEQEFPYLRGHLAALTNLLEGQVESTEKVCSEALAVLAAVDLEVIVEDPQIGGDLLGRLYVEVMGAADRSGRGTIYTPPSSRGCSLSSPRRVREKARRTAKWVSQRSDP